MFVVVFQFNHNFDSRQLDTISDFYAGGLIGVIQGWLLDDSGKKELDVVAHQIGRLVPHGIDGYISKGTLR